MGGEEFNHHGSGLHNNSSGTHLFALKNNISSCFPNGVLRGLDQNFQILILSENHLIKIKSKCPPIYNSIHWKFMRQKTQFGSKPSVS